MKAQYDDLVEQVPLAEKLLFRPYIEQYTLFISLGDVRGQAILDVACGDGFYSRQIAMRGASRVVGVDISAELIKAARTIEENQKLGIEYHVYDAAEMPILGQFDLGVAAYLFHYASTFDQLLSMCRCISNNLRPGGRLVSVAANPNYDVKGPNSTKYGLTMRFPEALAEGSRVEAEVLVEPPFVLQLYHWSQATHEKALQEAGFKNIKWHNPVCSPEGKAKFGEQFWMDYLNNPHAVLLECER